MAGEGRYGRSGGRRGPAPVRGSRKGGIGLAGALVVALCVALLVAGLVLIGRSLVSRMGDGGEDSAAADATQQVAADEPSAEDALASARDRLCGTWQIAAISWAGEAGDAAGFPTKVTIESGGKVEMAQGESVTSGSWAMDGGAAVATMRGDGGEVRRILSSDGTQLSISIDNGTASYVRIAREGE